MERNRHGRILYFPNAAAFMRRERFDVVQAFSATANLYARLPAMLAGVPVIFGSMLGKRHFASKAMAVACSLTNIGSSGWILNSRDLEPILRQSLRFLGGLNVCVIPNGFEPAEAIDYRSGEHTFYDDLRKHRLVVAAIGRLVPAKDHGLYLEAASRVVAAGLDVEFWLIGDGPEFGQHQQWIADRGLEDSIKLLGHRNDVDVALSRVDLLVHTSLTEGCPNVLIEAMRARKPVVCTQCTDLTEMIDDGNNGYRVPVGNCDALVQAVLRILDMNDSDRSRMGHKSFELFERSFLMDRSAARFRRVYTDALIKAAKARPELRAKLLCAGLLNTSCGQECPS
jgi:starch synthase (maltosyl-transferring)